MRLLLSFVVLLLAGCASQTATIQYYLLYSPQDARHQTMNNPVTVRLSRLTVPEYLKQRGMPVMTQQNQVHISKSHMWAESFEISTNKLLRYALEPEVLLVSNAIDNHSDTELSLDILHLIPTDNGEVAISARYQLRREGEILLTQAYAKSYTLSEDGYAHSVDVYRKALFALAKDIGDNLQTL